MDLLFIIHSIHSFCFGLLVHLFDCLLCDNGVDDGDDDDDDDDDDHDHDTRIYTALFPRTQ